MFWDHFLIRESGADKSLIQAAIHTFVGDALEEFALGSAIPLPWEENLIKKHSKAALEWKFVE